MLPPTLWCVSRSQHSVLSMSGKWELVLSHSSKISWSTVSNYLCCECLIILIFIDCFDLVFTGCLLRGDMECGWLGVREGREMVGTEYSHVLVFGKLIPMWKWSPVIHIECLLKPKEIGPKGWGAAHRRIPVEYLVTRSQLGWGWQLCATRSASVFYGIFWILQVWIKCIPLKRSKLRLKPAGLCQSEQLPGRWNLLAPSNLLCIIFIITKLAVLSCGLLGNVVFFSLNTEILNDMMFLLHKVEAGMEVEQSSTLRRSKELWPKPWGKSR